MNLITLVTFAAGAILIYSAIKGYNPIDVVKQAVGGKKAGPVFTNSSFGGPAAPSGGGTSSGGGYNI